MQLPPLDSGPIPFIGIRDAARKQLLDIIDSRRGKKALVLEPSISGPLTQLHGSLSELFAEHGVVKLLYLEDKPLDDASYNLSEPKLVDIKNIIYVVRASVENAQQVAAQVKQALRSPAPESHEFSVFFVPRRTIACERALEAAGVYGDLALGELAFDLVPYDADLLSLELDEAFRDCVLDGDSTALFGAARALMRVQAMFGTFPRIQGKGFAAAAVKDMCIKMRREQPAPPAAASSAASSSKIDRVILIDREVDVVTPMITQITYEGLIDEVTGIKYGAVPWQPKERKAPGAAAAEVGGSGSAAETRGGGGAGAAAKGSLMLNSTDPYYAEFRDLPYGTFTQKLQQYAKEARREYVDLGSKELSELKTFVKGLPKLMMLDRLSDIAVPLAECVKQQHFHNRLQQERDIVDGLGAEEAVHFMQELIWKGTGLMEVLRLLVLLSACNSGIPRKHWDALRTDVLHTYGHEHILTMLNLEKAGLIKLSPGGRSSFATIRKGLRLSVPDEDEQNPSDVAHLYRGYAPLSIRLVETAMAGGWGSSTTAEALTLLPGPHFDLQQTVDASGQPVDKPYKAPASGAAPSGGETVLVVFLGGCTYTELSALRWLGRRSDPPTNFVALTTKVVNGTSLLQAFLDPVAKATLEQRT